MIETDIVVRAIRCGKHHTHSVLEDSRIIQAAVFVHEHGIAPEQVFDGEHSATHYVLYKRIDDQYEVVACARASLVSRDRSIMIERVAVMPEHRGQRYARRLLEHIINEQGERYRPPFFCLNARPHATGLYETLDFTPVGSVFVHHDGLKRIRMERLYPMSIVR